MAAARRGAEFAPGWGSGWNRDENQNEIIAILRRTSQGGRAAMGSAMRPSNADRFGWALPLAYPASVA
jgi:hypothetical protein